MIEDKKQDEKSSSDSGYVIVPLKTPLGLTEGGESHAFDQQLSFHSVGDSVDETVLMLVEGAGIAPDESLTRAAQCGAFWKSVGVETLIYMCSYGGTLIANGIILHVTNLDTLTSTMLTGTAGILAYPHARIVFNSLMRPPLDTVPEDKQARFEALEKYGFLPASWFITSLMSGSTLAVLNDSSFGTQQIISAVTTVAAGPIIQMLRSSTRTCLKGSLVINPPYEDLSTAFKTAYSTEPNPQDESRTYRWGLSRNTISHFLALSTGTLMLTFGGGYNIETYCIGGRDELKKILDSGNSTITNDDLSRYCFGGPTILIFRDLGISLAYGLCMVVIEPTLNLVFNKIYDYFYPRQQETSSDILIEEVSDEDSNNT